MPEYYEIKIKGHMDPCWSDWFASLNIAHLEENETLLSGPLPDQAALHGLLERIRHDFVIVPTSGAFEVVDYWLPVFGGRSSRDVMPLDWLEQAPDFAPSPATTPMPASCPEIRSEPGTSPRRSSPT